jgi:hypothetical protein
MSQEDKQHCLGLARNYISRIESSLRGMKQALNSPDDIQQQTGYLYALALHEFLTEVAPSIVQKQMQKLYDVPPVEH